MMIVGTEALEKRVVDLGEDYDAFMRRVKELVPHGPPPGFIDVTVRNTVVRVRFSPAPIGAWADLY